MLPLHQRFEAPRGRTETGPNPRSSFEDGCPEPARDRPSGKGGINSASGPEIWLPAQFSAGVLSGKPQHRPSGRTSAGRKAEFEAFPTTIQPTSGPEARVPARKQYCIAESRSSDGATWVKPHRCPDKKAPSSPRPPTFRCGPKSMLYPAPCVQSIMESHLIHMGSYTLDDPGNPPEGPRKL